MEKSIWLGQMKDFYLEGVFVKTNIWFFTMMTYQQVLGRGKEKSYWENKANGFI